MSPEAERQKNQEFTVSSKQRLKTHCLPDLQGNLAWALASISLPVF
jgi:hypothetical protein